jgi:hypothetical protein
MTVTLELPEALADALTAEAARRGMALPEYALHLLTTARPTANSVQSGADLVAYWKAEGLIGSRPDLADSQEEARSLREQAQNRGA